jgi:hypothetical protein
MNSSKDMHTFSAQCDERKYHSCMPTTLQQMLNKYPPQIKSLEGCPCRLQEQIQMIKVKMFVVGMQLMWWRLLAGNQWAKPTPP